MNDKNLADNGMPDMEKLISSASGAKLLTGRRQEEKYRFTDYMNYESSPPSDDVKKILETCQMLGRVPIY